MLKDYFTLAYRSTKKRKLRSWLTMLGIFIGIAAIVSLVSLSQGMQKAIQEQFLKLGSDKLILQAAGSGFGPPGTAVSVPLTTTELEAIQKVNGVKLAVGRLLRITKLEFKDEVKYSYVASLPENEKERKLITEANNYQAGYGRLLEKNDLYKVLLGHDFADNFFKEPLLLRNKIKIQDQTFEVIGILKKSGNPQQDSALVIPERALREILNIETAYDIIVAQTTTGESVDRITNEIKQELRKVRHVEEGKENFNIQTPENLLATLTSILTIIQGVLVGLAGISLVVGGLGIMNTMYTAVLERTKEIGIMKAAGARNEQIMLLFLIESGFLGLFGGLIGVILGYSISKAIELIAFQIYESFLIQANFNIWFILGMLLFAFLIGSISGVLPARRAAKLKPIEALRQ
ncbi:ABC transporter permease [Candidatus Woesearchaeota archaeon]|nr:ABC transporter permease [Candidatus Woesearchaeota archaeon]